MVISNLLVDSTSLQPPPFRAYAFPQGSTRGRISLLNSLIIRAFLDFPAFRQGLQIVVGYKTDPWGFGTKNSSRICSNCSRKTFR